jgi:hypothetical protein
MDELAADITEGVILLGILNSFSPRSSFFTDLALLGSFNKNIEMPQGSS